MEQQKEGTFISINDMVVLLSSLPDETLLQVIELTFVRKNKVKEAKNLIQSVYKECEQLDEKTTITQQ